MFACCRYRLIGLRHENVRTISVSTMTSKPSQLLRYKVLFCINTFFYKLVCTCSFDYVRANTGMRVAIRE
jgi:hypothetical protein